MNWAAVIFAAVLSLADRDRVRSVPGAAQHAAGPRHRAAQQLRQARRRPHGAAIPHDAGDGADRARDGAADERGPLSQESLEGEARRPRRPRREPRHVLGDAGAERLRLGADARAVHAHRGRAGGAARRVGGDVGDGPAHRGKQLEQHRQREGFKADENNTNSSASFNAIGSGHFRAIGVPLLTGREFTDADDARAPKGRHRQRDLRATLRPRRESGGKAHGRRLVGYAAARHRDRRPRARHEVLERQARDSAGVLHAAPPDVARQLDVLLRAHRVRSRRRCCAR